MTWEEKLSALQCLCDTCLRMRSPGDWYVSASGRQTTKPDSVMLTGTYGDGTTPERAVEDDWAQLQKIFAEGGYVVIDAMRPTRKHLAWSGFMWKELPVASAACGMGEGK